MTDGHLYKKATVKVKFSVHQQRRHGDAKLNLKSFIENRKLCFSSVRTLYTLYTVVEKEVKSVKLGYAAVS